MKNRGLLFILVCISICLSANTIKPKEIQKILFIDSPDSSKFQYLSSMEFDGNHPQHLIQIRDTFAVNKQNGLIAAGCAEEKAICIINFDLLPDWSTYPPQISTVSPNKGKIPFPDYCKNSLECFITSLSWSNDGNRLLVIIKNGITSYACISDIKGKYQCWGEKSGDDIYARADWSQTNGLIVLDTGLQYNLLPKGENGFRIERTGRTMIIVNSDGELQQTLIDGWSPAWSPDGSEIAFFRADDERRSPGIAIIKSDGTGFNWVYRSPVQNEDDPAYSYRPIIEDSFSESGPSKISWSTDKRYLVFDSIRTDNSRFFVMKLEIATGKLERLTTNITQGFHETLVNP